MTEPLRDYPFELWYPPSTDLPNPRVDDFYIPALNRAVTYDRAVGYFRSSIFFVTGVAMTDFAQRDGRMRVVCSPSLTEEDQQVIRTTGGISSSQIERSIKNDLDRAVDDVAENAALVLLATLLTHGILDLRVAFKRDERGIFHPKIGMISDGTDTLTFSGSINETYMAWAHNEEELSADRSWGDDSEKAKANRRVQYFEELWDDRRSSVRTVPLTDITREELEKHAVPDPEEAIERVLDLSRTKQVLPPIGPGKPKTRTRTLQAHQIKSRDNWWQSRRGIVCYVTGGGKTFTALEIIKLWLDDHPDGAVIVLVPSDLLAKQWRKQLDAEAPALSILQVGGDDSDRNWKIVLPDITSHTTTHKRRVVLAVMHSAASEAFINRARVGEHTLVVADEVHRVGAKHLRKALTLEAGGRLGLSATPERYGDEEGTEVIFDYFGEKLEPAFTIRDAQEAGRLVPYFYYPEIVPLEPSELQEYRDISKRIRQLAGQAASTGSADTKDLLRRKLIERARILKSANSKAPFAADLVASKFEDGDRWLVYCDSRNQLNEVQQLLAEANISSLEYTSAMAFSKEETIRYFEERGGVLLAIECLDEGIDIPSITHALVLASSTNPRQHLQRRGRVLRMSGDKALAMIYDTLVAPDVNALDIVFDQDLSRATNFAAEARNRTVADITLNNLGTYTDTEGDSWSDFEEDD